MLKNEKKICEYFLISGFNKNRRLYDLTELHNQGEEICITNVESEKDFFHYKDPIVDIQIVHWSSRGRLSSDYRIIDRTYSKLYKADFNSKTSTDELYLCFRYGRDLPPITELRVINPKSKHPSIDGHWHLIESTVNGQSANLHSSSTQPLFLGYRRAAPNAPVDSLVLTDICVILANKHESCPPAYTIVDGPIKRSPIGNIAHICYKRSVVKQHVLTFQPEIIYCLSSRSPEAIVDVYHRDSGKFKSPDCLPDDIRDVANFCMPWGATLESWPSHLLSPAPSFITFVLTNIKYDRLYGAAMLFYEDFDVKQLTEEETTNLGLDLEQVNHMRVFASKSICILSRCPLFQSFNKVLSFLIEEDDRQRNGNRPLSSQSSIPLERFISQFLYFVPFPSPEVPNLLLQWDLKKPISIQLPTDPISKFGTSENFYHLVRLLDVEQIIQLFVYMLTEQKILVTSTNNSDLTRIAEALLSMIFPFQWSVVYIPFLYLGCIHIIQSPSPYLIGVDSRFFDYFCLPEGVGCVDLINKSIKPPDVHSKFFDYNKVFPKSILRTLRAGLCNCKVEVDAFEKTQRDHYSNGNSLDLFSTLRKLEIIGESVRECFLRAVVMMFKNYQNYLLPVLNKETNDDMFNAQGFLKSVEKHSRPLYLAIFDTQLWNHFILDRSYVTEFDNSLAFFDRCIKFVQAMDEDRANMSSLLQTDSVIRSEHTKVVEGPSPVKDWWPGGNRRTFLQRLDSSLMLRLGSLEEEVVAGESVVQVSPISEKCCKRSPMQSNLGSSIPEVLLRSISRCEGLHDSVQTRETTVLRRPQEEVKQAQQLGKEAKRGSEHAWAGHLLASSYCLWYLCLPGLIGYVQDTVALAGTGLAERILELSVEIIQSLVKYRLILPDQVCVRILLLLVRQITPPRVRISSIGRQSYLNVFSYGLYNQILLEEDTPQATNWSPCGTPPSHEVKGDLARHNPALQCDQMDVSATESIASINDDVALETDNRFLGNETLETCLEEQEDDETVQSKRITSRVLYQSSVNLCDIEAEKRHQFFDRTNSLVMTSQSPDLVEYSEASMATMHDITDSPIILARPSSEECSQLHASMITNDDGASKDDDRWSPGSHAMTSGNDHDRSAPINPGKAPIVKVNRSRASFRQLKSSANRSFRTIRRFLSSVATESLVQTPGSRSNMPETFRPWDQGIIEQRSSMTLIRDSGLTIAIERTSPDSLQRRIHGTTETSPGLDGSRRETADPPIVTVDQIWERITGSLSAVRLPPGLYLDHGGLNNGQVSSSVECQYSLSVVMTSASECSHCHWLVYDDDIMNGWTYDDSDLRSVCPYCGQRFIPLLSFKVVVNEHNMDPNGNRTNIKLNKLAYESVVIYLSPFVIRKEMESVLSHEGEEALLRGDFLPRHSILYWNLMLTYGRLSLPSHMLSFVTLWLRDNGRRLTTGGGSDNNVAKCDILTSLTGHEEVSVTFVLEMDTSGRSNVPPALYRMYLDKALLNQFTESLSVNYSPNTTLLDDVVTSLYECDIRRAILSLIRLRSQVDRRLVKCQRSTYRELMHLAILVLGKHRLNLESFHYMFQFDWSTITKSNPPITDDLDKPLSNRAFYCRKVFRPPLL